MNVVHHRYATVAGRQIFYREAGDPASPKLLLLGGSLKAKDPKALNLMPEDLSFEPYAIALPRNDSTMRQAVNAGLTHIYREGEIVSIFNKWFGAFGEPTGLMRAMFIFGAVPE